MKAKKNYLLAVWRVFALVVWIAVMPLIFFAGRALNRPGFTEIPHHFHRGMCCILGMRVTRTGELHEQAPTLFLSNHISYLDVFALGNIRAYFIAKSEVANWPILGTYAQFQNTLFFERKQGRAKDQLSVMQTHLQQNKNLILFVEGTSTNGTYVGRFKSSLIESANSTDLEHRVTIQPITIAYTHQAGIKMDQQVRDHYAWYARMPFGSHAAALLPLKKVDVKIHFHPVCYLDQFETRKACADHCQALVAAKLAEFLA